jgi:hypothetical protein
VSRRRWPDWAETTVKVGTPALKKKAPAPDAAPADAPAPAADAAPTADTKPAE